MLNSWSHRTICRLDRQNLDTSSWRSSIRVAFTLLVLATAVAACESGGATEAEPLPVESADAVEAITQGMDGVTSARTVTDLVAHVGGDTSTVLRFETWADLEAERARTVLSEPDTPTSDVFVETEEAVVVGGLGYRRSGDSEWVETSDRVVSMLLAGIDATGDDVPAALQQFAQSESGVWTSSTSGNEVVTYRRTGDAAAENVVVDIGEDGFLVSISLDQRPTGARSDNPLFYRTTVTFEDLGSTVVDAPSDLPVD